MGPAHGMGIDQRIPQPHASRAEWNIVEIALGIGSIKIDGRRNNLIPES
jgi:hypothetical protein